MKKPIIFSVLIILAGGLMWGIDYLSSVPPLDKTALGGIVQEPKVVRDFKAFCDTMRDSKWEPEAFQERIDRLNVYKQQKIVNASEFLNLEEYMYSAYANSIENTYTDWKLSCNVPALKDIHAELKRISTFNSACNSKLQAPLKEVASFYALLNMPNKVEKIIRGEFNAASYNKIVSEVQSLPNHFNSCSNVNSAKRDADNALNKFKNFTVDYSDALNAYQINPNDFYTLNDLRKLCKKAKQEGYANYITKLKDSNVCN